MLSGHAVSSTGDWCISGFQIHNNIPKVVSQPRRRLFMRLQHLANAPWAYPGDTDG